MEKYIIKKTKRKTMAITINSKGEVIVSVPNRTPDRVVFEFVDKHKDWINEKLSKINSVLRDNEEIWDKIELKL